MDTLEKHFLAVVLFIFTVSSCQKPIETEKPLSPDLLTDKQLAITTEAIPLQENEAFTAWIQENHYPIRSLTAEHYDDLDFLPPLLQGKRIVQLGEMAHGVTEINDLRVRLIKYLHEELGYDIIAFESSFFECSYLERLDLSANDKLLGSLFGIWHTEEVLSLFEYIEKTKKTEHPLHLVGFDIQISNVNTALALRPQFLQGVVAKIDADYANQVYEFDTVFFDSFVNNATDKSYWLERGEGIKADYEKLLEFLDNHMEKLVEQFPQAPQFPLIARQTVWSMTQYIQALQSDDDIVYMTIRDKSMAENVDFVLERLYPGSKIILWAHNGHVRYKNENVVGNAGWQGVKTMGGWLSEKHYSEMYTIGGYAYRGQVALNNRQVYEIPLATIGSLESVLHQTRRKYIFVDFTKQVQDSGNSWMFQELTANEFAMSYEPMKMVPREQYDAILFIDTVSVPKYLY